MELDPADFQSELPEQHIHVYYEDADLGLSVGVWTTTTMQEAFGPYPGDEFMWVLEGQVSMVDADENEILVKAGETFCIRDLRRSARNNPQNRNCRRWRQAARRGCNGSGHDADGDDRTAGHRR